MRREHAEALGFGQDATARRNGRPPTRQADPAPSPHPVELPAPRLERLGHGYRLTWADPALVVTATGLREHSEGVAAELLVTHAGAELSWGKVNLASPRSRAELVKGLAGQAPRVPWSAVIDRTCRLVVEAARAGSPAVAVVPRRRAGPRYLLEPLAPAGETTVLAGDGGTGKGYLASTLALGISADARLPAGLSAGIRGPVLYLDWESTEEEFAERVLLLAHGLGCRVRHLHYKPMVAPLAAELPAVAADVHRLGAVAVIVDSLAPACGPEPEGADAAVRTMMALRSLAPASRLVLAHVSKASAEGAGPARPFGSVFIQNLARSVWEVRRSDDDDGDELLLGLYHRKVNTGRRHRPLALRLTFEGEAIRVTGADLAAAPDLAARASLPHRLRLALAEGALTVADLAARLQASEDSIGRVLRRLKDRDQVVQVGDRRPYLWGLAIR